MQRLVRFAMAAAVVGMCAGRAEAATITVFVSGNDCGNQNCVANETGTFSNTAGITGSPFIIKFNGNGSVAEINAALYPTITGAEFTFTPALNGSLGSGSWTYTPGAGDPAVRFWTGKGGPNYNLFYDNGADNVGGAEAVTSGTWATPINPNNSRPYGISHISFYDTGATVPEPATLLLFGTAAVAAGLRRRRRK